MAVIITAGNYNMGEVELRGEEVLIDHVFPAAGMPDMAFVPPGGEKEP